jgi:hypothetical protein
MLVQFDNSIGDDSDRVSPSVGSQCREAGASMFLVRIYSEPVMANVDFEIQLWFETLNGL